MGVKVYSERWPTICGRNNGQGGLQIGTGGRGREGYKSKGDVSAEMVKMSKLAYR